MKTAKVDRREIIQSDKHFDSVLRTADFLLSNLDLTGTQHERARRMIKQLEKYAEKRDTELGCTRSELFCRQVIALQRRHA